MLVDNDYLLIKRFKNDYTYMADDIVDAEVRDKWTVDLTMKDGRKLQYDCMDGSAQVIKNSSDMNDTEWKKALGRRIRRYLWLRGMTQKELADEMKISQGIISSYINGNNLPSARNLKKISDALNCTVSDLVDF